MTQNPNELDDVRAFTPSIPPAGPISTSFLTKSVITLVRKDPLTISHDAPVRSALELLRNEKAGCVLVLSGDTLAGIFTERDCILKVVATYCEGTSEVSVSQFMTADPVTVTPDAPIAYALNLMSHGGFRHLPIVSEGVILGLVSVKDVVDGLVHSMVEEIEKF